MARIVRKYGGSSLRKPEQIRTIARHIVALKRDGNDVVVVVSAMAATTDELLELAKTLHPSPPRREMDMLLSVGERISCSLLAMAIEAEGEKAISYTGSQVGIITDTHHGEARIVDVKPFRLLEALDNEQIVVVAGFQGVSINKEITTLGRGGSDLTAIALAKAINADRAELMKEVDGLFTAHPEVVHDAKLLRNLTYENALNLARGGANALQSEAARLAKDHKVTLGVGNSSTDSIGTIITDRPLDCGDIVGIASIDGLCHMEGSGSIPENLAIIRFYENSNGWNLWYEADKNSENKLSGITIVTGGRRIDGLHQCILETLKDAQIEYTGCFESLSECWISVPTDYANKTVKLLHNAFRLHSWLCSENHEIES